MSYQIVLHPEAVDELLASYQWYEERADGLVIRFVSAVDKKLNDIIKNPNKYAKKKGQHREAGIEVFPYSIIYEIFEKEQVVFVSYIFHTKRNPKLKYKR